MYLVKRQAWIDIRVILDIHLAGYPVRYLVSCRISGIWSDIRYLVGYLVSDRISGIRSDIMYLVGYPVIYPVSGYRYPVGYPVSGYRIYTGIRSYIRYPIGYPVSFLGYPAGRITGYPAELLNK